MKNKYAKRSRISEARIREVVRYFAADLTALQAAILSGLNRNTVNRLALRERIQLACEVQRPLVVEIDESFVRQGRCGRGARPLSSASSNAKTKSEIVPDCPTLHYSWPGGPEHRHQLRWLARLRRLGRPRLRPLPGRPFQGGVHQGSRPHQRHRGLLGLGSADQVQGPAQTHPPSTSRKPNGATDMPCYNTKTHSARHDLSYIVSMSYHPESQHPACAPGGTWGSDRRKAYAGTKVIRW